MYKMRGCACNPPSGAGQGMLYQFSNRFSAGVTERSRPEARQHVTTYGAGETHKEPRQISRTGHTVMRHAREPPYRQA